MGVGCDDGCPPAPMLLLTQHGDTALVRAACRGHVEVVEALLQRGADINATDQVRDPL